MITGRRVATLADLSEEQLAAADPRFPKWATMCLLRRLGLPVLNAALLPPDQGHFSIAASIQAMTAATGKDRLILRSDGGIETSRYYLGGNTFRLEQLPAQATALLSVGRAVLLLEPTNRFTNVLTAVLRMDRPNLRLPGTFAVEALGPGYDVADLTRGGISPQITVTAQVDWSRYAEPWWTDLRMTRHADQGADDVRRRRRLLRIATYILTDMGQLNIRGMDTDRRVIAAANWLRAQGFDHLWSGQDIGQVVARHARRWYEEAFVIAACHPNRNWTCLAAGISDIGGRWVFWDVIDGAHKYGAAVGARAA